MTKISMLLPTRGRPSYLRQSVTSVYDKAKNPGTIETLAFFDNDDSYAAQAREVLLAAKQDIHIFQGPRVGYNAMHIMNNGLAKRAHPDSHWLFIWNDDIEMVTQSWDELLLDCPAYAIQFPRRDTVKTSDCTVPVMSRGIHKVLGHMALNAYCDAWISDFSAFAGTSVVRDDIVFTHHRLTDQTMRDGDDGGRELGKFKTDDVRAQRRADMDAVIASPLWAGRYDGWEVEERDHVGIDYVNLAAGEVKARSYFLKGRKT